MAGVLPIMSLCTCADVEFGVYSATVSMQTASDKWVAIDVCIATEIGRLWMNGVETLSCCCGHGKLVPSVVVAQDSIGRMRDLGYENDRSCYADRNDIFVLTGKPLPVRPGNPYYEAWQQRLRSERAVEPVG